LAIKALAPLYAEVPPGPKWLETAVFYQIYPQSFFDSNGDGIGDFHSLALSGSRQIYIEPTSVLQCKSAVCGLKRHPEAGRSDAFGYSFIGAIIAVLASLDFFSSLVCQYWLWW
jgi:hypothetical protein